MTVSPLPPPLLAQSGWRIRDKPAIGRNIIKQASCRWNDAEGERGGALGNWCTLISFFDPSSALWGLVIPPFKVGDQVALSGFLNIHVHMTPNSETAI